MSRLSLLQHFLCLSVLLGLPCSTEEEKMSGFYRMTSILGYRHDGRCGYTYRLREGAPARCSVYGKSPCCNYLKEECGHGTEYCDCEDCTDFRTFNLAEKEDSINPSKEDRRHIISVLTEHLNLQNWSTIDHVQYSKRVNSTRRNYVFIVRESLCPKSQPLDLDNCSLKDDVIHRLACFVAFDKTRRSARVANKDCIRAKVYEKRVRSRPARLRAPPISTTNSSSLLRFILMKLSQMDGGERWFTSVGGQSLTPHKNYNNVIHAELKITPSTCPRSRKFVSSCPQLKYGPAKSCAVDVQIRGNSSYRLIHYTCDAICGPFSNQQRDFERGLWTHWSSGMCHKGTLSKIRFCYHPMKSEPAFDCRGRDIELTEC